jgi:hypothetical protein
MIQAIVPELIYNPQHLPALAGIQKRVAQVLATPPPPRRPTPTPPGFDNGLAAWALATPAPDDPSTPGMRLDPPLPEAPASVNVRVQVAGREVQWTLRDTDEARLAARLEALLARYSVLAPPPQVTSQGQGKDWGGLHHVQMRWNEGKEGRQG